MKKTVWTLNDIAEAGFATTGGEERASSDARQQQPWQHGDSSSSFKSSNHAAAPLQCYHIPTLVQADTAKKFLEQVVREFAPIVHRRGYNVTFVSELCCCGDGIDFALTGRRKCRQMGSNLWGYNRTHSSGGNYKCHEIHIRLRHAGNHGQFHDYEDVAGTLAHELAHCVHGPHNQHFYKLMDEIIDEHASLMANGLMFPNHNILSTPAFSGQGQALGGSNKTGKSRLLTAAAAGRCLGGDKALAQWLTPREAAAAAAVARRWEQQKVRLRGGNHCCVIEILNDKDDDDDGSSQQKGGAKEETKKPAVLNVRGANRTNGADRDGPSSSTASLPDRRTVKKPKTTEKGPIIDLTISDNEDWSCLMCTFRNSPAVTMCTMCASTKSTPRTNQ